MEREASQSPAKYCDDAHLLFNLVRNMVKFRTQGFTKRLFGAKETKQVCKTKNNLLAKTNKIMAVKIFYIFFKHIL